MGLKKEKESHYVLFKKHTLKTKQREMSKINKWKKSAKQILMKKQI